MFRVAKIIAAGLLFSSAPSADGDDWRYRTTIGMGITQTTVAESFYVPQRAMEYFPRQPRLYPQSPLPRSYYGYDAFERLTLIGQKYPALRFNRNIKQALSNHAEN